MEITNLTEGNVESLEEHLKDLQKENPDIKYKIFQMDERFKKLVEESQKNTIEYRLSQLGGQIESLHEKIDRIFGKQILIDGNWVQL